jgi:GxxExxY protein
MTGRFHNRERTQGTQKEDSMNTDQMMALCDQVRETAYAIHQHHGNGYLEKVYENALVHRLRKSGLNVKQQHQLIIYDDDGTEIGEYYADLLIENELIIELKACKDTTHEHYAQLLHYLKGSKKEHGLLINFGAYKFQIKKFAKTDQTNILSRTSAMLPSTIFAFLAFFRG